MMDYAVSRGAYLEIRRQTMPFQHLWDSPKFLLIAFRIPDKIFRQQLEIFVDAHTINIFTFCFQDVTMKENAFPIGQFAFNRTAVRYQYPIFVTFFNLKK